MVETQRRGQGEALDRTLKGHKPEQSTVHSKAAMGRRQRGGGGHGVRGVKVVSEASGQLCRRKKGL